MHSEKGSYVLKKKKLLDTLTHTFGQPNLYIFLVMVTKGDYIYIYFFFFAFAVLWFTYIFIC